MTYATDFSHASADVVHSPPYRGRVRLRARTIAGTEALESLLDRESEGVLYLSRCGTKAAVDANAFERMAEDLIHDYGVDLEEAWMGQMPAADIIERTQC